MLENMLEDATFELFPEVKEFKDLMIEALDSFVMMSGSGSSLFGLAGKELPEVIGSKKLLIVDSISKAEYKEGIGAWPSGKAPVFGAGMRRFESSRPSK